MKPAQRALRPTLWRVEYSHATCIGHIRRRTRGLAVLTTCKHPAPPWLRHRSESRVERALGVHHGT